MAVGQRPALSRKNLINWWKDDGDEARSQDTHRWYLTVLRIGCSQAALPFLGDHVAATIIGPFYLVDELGAGVVSISRSRIKENGKDPSTLSGALVPQVHAYPSLLGTSRWCLPLIWSHISDVENVAINRLPRVVHPACPPEEAPRGRTVS